MRLRTRVQMALESIGQAFAVGQIYPRVGLVPDWPDYLWGSPYGLTDEEIQHGDAFRQIPIVHAIVSLIQTDAASLERKFYQGEREIERKPGNIVDVFLGANHRHTGYEFMLNLHGDLELYGNAYIFLERGRGRAPSVPPYAVWTLHPPLVKVEMGANRRVARYLWHGSSTPEEIPEWSVIHIARYNPADGRLGVTWVEAARDDWMAQYYALKLLREFYRRGGVVPGTWAFDGEGKPPTEADVRKMQTQYASRFQNIESAFKLIIMDKMKQIDRGQSITDLKLDEMIRLMNADLCRAARVPPWMLGIKESGSLDQGKSSETSTENYWRSTIGGTVKLVDSVLNERFCPLFGAGIEIETSLENVPALQASRLELTKSLVIAAGSPILTVNEARESVDYEETGDPAHDEIAKPAPPEPFGAAPDSPPREPSAAEERDTEPAEEEAASRNGHERRMGARIVAGSAAQRRERLRRRQERRLHREERLMASLWNEIRNEQERYAVKHLVRQQEDATFAANDLPIQIDVEDLYRGLTDAQKKAIERRLRETMETAGEAAADEIGAQAALDLHAASVERYILHRVEVMIQNVEAVDRTKLREGIGERVARGDQWSQIAEWVHEFFDGRRGNSMTIARTEVAGPYNRAQYQVWKDGGVRRKFWMTMGDEAVRLTHQVAGDTYSEQRSIGIDEPFIVGGHACMMPGETGDPGEDINCRCQVLPDLEQFEQGIAAKERLERGAWLKGLLTKGMANGVAK